MKIVIAIAVVMLVAPFALASNTGGAGWQGFVSPEFADSHFAHGHNYSQTSSYKAPLGYGVDLTLYEMDIANVGVGIGLDGTYDQNNGVWGCFAKVRINTTQLINKLIGK